MTTDRLLSRYYTHHDDNNMTRSCCCRCVCRRHQRGDDDADDDQTIKMTTQQPLQFRQRQMVCTMSSSSSSIQTQLSPQQAQGQQQRQLLYSSRDRRRRRHHHHHHCLRIVPSLSLFAAAAGAIVIVVFLVTVPVLVYGHDEIFDFERLQTNLPKPISDHTATVVYGQVFLAGGCDAVDGNVYNEENGQFNCFSVSKSVYKFDPVTETTVQLSDLPSERYRHAAVPVANRIWIVGGRDVDDNIVSRVDVYNIDTNKWRSFTDLPSDLYASDNAGFAHGNQAFFVGGYSDSYEFKDDVYAIDTVPSLETGTLHITRKAPLALGRGDLSAVSDDRSTFAIVIGGFGPTYGFCEQAPEVEFYDFDSDTWTNIMPMRIARSDQGLVELNGDIIAFGGERQLREICGRIGMPDPGEQTLAVDVVEMLRVHGDDTNDYFWQNMANLPDHRFRFAAVAIDEQDAIYTFGGQLEYNPDCMCYKSTDDILKYVREHEEHTQEVLEETSSSTIEAEAWQVNTILIITLAGIYAWLLQPG